MAKVFIGIPTINRPEFVRQTIRSVLVQTYPDFEVVVSDNCSDPGVADQVTGLGKPSWTNSHPAAGARVLIIDDDDRLNAVLTEYLARFGFSVRTATHPDAGLRAIRADPRGGQQHASAPTENLNGVETGISERRCRPLSRSRLRW